MMIRSFLIRYSSSVIFPSAHSSRSCASLSFFIASSSGTSDVVFFQFSEACFSMSWYCILWILYISFSCRSSESLFERSVNRNPTKGLRRSETRKAIKPHIFRFEPMTHTIIEKSSQESIIHIKIIFKY